MTLPPGQRRIFNELVDRFQGHGQPVGVTELASHFQISKPSIYEALRVLERKGAIRRIPIGEAAYMHRYAPVGGEQSDLLAASRILNDAGHAKLARRLAAIAERGWSPNVTDPVLSQPKPVGGWKAKR